MVSQIFFFNSLTCSKDSVTPAVDTACLHDLVEDNITLVACPAPSCDNTPRLIAAQKKMLFEEKEKKKRE